MVVVRQKKNLTFSHAKERKVTLLLARHCSCGVTVVISLVLLEVRAGVRSAQTRLACENGIVQGWKLRLKLRLKLRPILTLIGMSYDSKKNDHLQRHLGAFFIRLNELGRVSNYPDCSQFSPPNMFGNLRIDVKNNWS